MAEGNLHFLDSYRATLVQSIVDVDTTLDKLLGRELITSEQYARIMAAKTTQEKMRLLIDFARGWDTSSKDKLCDYLKQENITVTIFDSWKPIQGDNEYIYGDVLIVECSGASKATVIRNGLAGVIGVEASYAIAERHVDAIRALKNKIKKVGKHRGIDPSLIAGLISRASSGGTLLQNGWGQYNNCFGLMQVSPSWHKIRGEWDSEEHIDQGTEILVSMIEAIKMMFPKWSPAWHLKGGTAAYICGQSNVHSYKNVDEHTDNKDFSNDVITRAQWYKKHVFS